MIYRLFLTTLFVTYSCIASAVNPTVTIKWTPSTVAYGGNSTLSWSSKNASKCYLNGDEERVRPTSYTWLGVNRTKDTKSSIYCTGPGGESALMTAELNVIQPDPVVSVKWTPSTVVYGGSSTLSWSSTYAENCYLDGESRARPTSYSWVGTNRTKTTSTYVICTNSNGGETRDDTMLTVNIPDPIVDVKWTPSTVAYGGTSTLSWSSTYAENCYLDGESRARPTSYSWVGTNRTKTTPTYVICTNSDGGETRVDTKLTVNLPPAPTLVIMYSPSIITIGDRHKLDWSSSNTTECYGEEIKSEDETTTGSWTYTREDAGDFSSTVTCTGPGGSVTKSPSYTVRPLNAPSTIKLEAKHEATNLLSKPSNGTIDVSWNIVGNALTYILEYSTDGAAWEPAYDGGAKSYTVSGINPATVNSYKFRVKACFNSYCSAYKTSRGLPKVSPSNAPAFFQFQNVIGDATAVDDANGALTVKAYLDEQDRIEVPVNFGSMGVGNYKLNYFAEDGDGNSTTVFRKIEIVNQAPVGIEIDDDNFDFLNTASGFNGTINNNSLNGYDFHSNTNTNCPIYKPNGDYNGVKCSRNELNLGYSPIYSIEHEFDFNLGILGRHIIVDPETLEEKEGSYPYVVIWQVHSYLTPLGNYPQAALSITDNGIIGSNGKSGLKLVMTTNAYPLDASHPYCEPRNEAGLCDKDPNGKVLYPSYIRESITIIDNFDLNTNYALIVKLHPGADEETGFMEVVYGGVSTKSQNIVTYRSDTAWGHSMHFGQYWDYNFNQVNIEGKIESSLMNMNIDLTN